MAHIIESSENDGGKSGEFFFQTYDNKLLFKTIPMTELIKFEAILHQYYRHLQDNPRSLIVKILGVYKFTFNNNTSGEQIVVLM